MDLFKDIQTEIEFFFGDLNWTYVLIYVFVLYGIKHKEEFEWYNTMFDTRPKLKPFKVWAAGVIIMLIFSTFRSLNATMVFDSEYVSRLMRSWIIVIVFNSIFNKKIKEIDKN